MRKKELIKQNISLIEQLQETHAEIEELKQQLALSQKEISKLKESVCAQTEVQEEKVQEITRQNVTVKPDVDYGSKVIGELVVAAAQYSNKLTAHGDTANRELVNLILGKTEVAKSEILTIVSADDGLEVKKARIDAVAATAREYFESVMAQLN